MDPCPFAYRPALAAAFLALSLLRAVPSVSAQEAASEAPSDSLAFEMKKRKILESAPDVRMAAVVEAADELARDGFYAEALELIYDLEDTSWAAKSEAFLEEELSGEAMLPADTATVSAAPGAAPKTTPAALRELRSYVRSSLEYDDWDDMPIGGEVRAKLEWLPEDSFVERVTPTFAGSDRRAFVGMAARGSAFDRILKVEAEGLAERKMWQPYGDSLDRISAQAVVEAGTRPLGKSLSVSLPVRGEVEQYRHDRLGLLSRRTLGAAPTLEALSSDWRKSVMVAWEVRGYRFPTSRSSDFLRQGPFLLANWYGDRFTAELEGQLTDDRFRRDTSMFASRAWEARAAAFVRPFRRLKAGVRLQHNGERSRYADTLRTLAPVLADTVLGYRVDTLTGRYSLKGWVSSVQPVLTLEWASIYSASLSLAYVRGWFPIIGTYRGRELFPALYIDESYAAWKPEAGFSILSKRLFLNASAGYELHKPSPSPQYYTGYHEVLGLGGNLAWKMNPFVEADFSGLFRIQTRGSSSAAMDLMSFSAGLVSRFQ